MSSILIIAEHNGSNLNPTTSRTLQCALDIGGSIDILVLGSDCQSVADSAAALNGINKVLYMNNAGLQHPVAANLAPAIIQASEGYSHILFPSTTFGKDVAPRVAAKLAIPQISDLMAVHGERAFSRPVYASNAIAQVSVPDGLTILATVRTASFKAVDSSGSAPIENIELTADLPDHSRFISLKTEGGDRPDLQSAVNVVSGGRGVGSEENFKLIDDLAEKLGAAVGASRAAVDAGYIPNDLQVGQTGKIIAPDLYIAIGISGAIQHLTGIKDAGTIVAINKDPDAAIFEVADIGIVGDLFSIVPELTEAL